MGNWWDDDDKTKSKYSERNLFQSHFVHHKSQMEYLVWFGFGLCWVIHYSSLASYECLNNALNYAGDNSSTVVKVLCYKSEGRWFDPNWCQWIFH